MTNAITDPLVDGHEASLDTPDVEVDVTPEGVATVLINRPDRRNGLNWAVIEALSEAFETLHAADGVSVVVLRGKGGVFCAGMEPEWLLATADEARTVVDETATMLKRLWDMPALTVALVEGAAVGGGAWLASACDIVVATRDAGMNYLDGKLAASPEVISPYVTGILGAQDAGRLFATDRTYDAMAAQRLGLVQEVVADAGGLDVMAQRIAAAASGGGDDETLTGETIRRIAGARKQAGDQSGVRAVLDRARPPWTSE